MHEDPAKQEDSLQEEELEFTLASLEDSLPEVQDPLEAINPGTKEDREPTFSSSLLEEPIKTKIIALSNDFRDCCAWHYHEMPELNRKLV